MAPEKRGGPSEWTVEMKAYYFIYLFERRAAFSEKGEVVEDFMWGPSLLAPFKRVEAHWGSR